MPLQCRVCTDIAKELQPTLYSFLFNDMLYYKKYIANIELSKIHASIFKIKQL